MSEPDAVTVMREMISVLEEHFAPLRLDVRAAVIGTYEEAKCPLPGCGAALCIEVHKSGVVYADGVANPDLASTWSVGCTQGHVLVVPPDTAEDYYEYDDAAAARVRDLLASVFT